MQFNFRGQYDSTQSYAVGDVVSYVISSTTRYYYCLIANDSSSPQTPTTVDSNYWAILNALSNFPNSIDTFIYRSSIQAQDKSDIDTINQLTTQANLTSDQQTQLNNLITKQRNKLLLAEDLNAIQDSLTNLQIFFKDKLIPYMDGTTAGNLQNQITAINQDYSHEYSDDTGAANAYVITLSTAPTTYSTGMLVAFKAANANTGASTINVNGLGAKTIKKNISSDLASGDIKAGQIILLVYDGTNFQFASSSSPAVATASQAGIVKIGNGITVQADGTISATSYNPLTSPYARLRR